MGLPRSGSEPRDIGEAWCRGNQCWDAHDTLLLVATDVDYVGNMSAGIDPRRMHATRTDRHEADLGFSDPFGNWSGS